MHIHTLCFCIWTCHAVGNQLLVPRTMQTSAALICFGSASIPVYFKSVFFLFIIDSNEKSCKSKGEYDFAFSPKLGPKV